MLREHEPGFACLRARARALSREHVDIAWIINSKPVRRASERTARVFAMTDEGIHGFNRAGISTLHYVFTGCQRDITCPSLRP